MSNQTSDDIVASTHRTLKTNHLWLDFKQAMKQYDIDRQQNHQRTLQMQNRMDSLDRSKMHRNVQKHFSENKCFQTVINSIKNIHKSPFVDFAKYNAVLEDMQQLYGCISNTNHSSVIYSVSDTSKISNKYSNSDTTFSFASAPGIFVDIYSDHKYQYLKIWLKKTLESFKSTNLLADNNKLVQDYNMILAFDDQLYHCVQSANYTINQVAENINQTIQKNNYLIEKSQNQLSDTIQKTSKLYNK